MKAPRSLRHILPLVAVSGLLALGMAPLPPKWKVPDLGKLVRKPPAGSGLDLAILQNNGPDEVTLTSKGNLGTKSMTVPPDGVLVQFVIATGGKNIVIRDANPDGQGAKGTLIWAKWVEPKPGIGDPPGGGQ